MKKNLRILLLVILALFSTARLASAQNDPILQRFLPQAQATRRPSTPWALAITSCTTSPTPNSGCRSPLPRGTSKRQAS